MHTLPTDGGEVVTYSRCDDGSIIIDQGCWPCIASVILTPKQVTALFLGLVGGER